MFIVSYYKGHSSARSNAVVLENLSEWRQFAKKTGKKLRTIDNCQQGDYIRTDNGYYAPVLLKSVYPLTRTKKPYMRMRITLPQYRYENIKHTHLETYKRKYLNYNPARLDQEPVHFEAKASPSTNQRLVLDLIKKGQDIYSAYKLVFINKPRYKNRSEYFKFITNENFQYYLIKENIMDLDDELENNGINMDWFLRNLKETVEDPKATSKAKAFDILERMLSNKGKRAKKDDVIKNENIKNFINDKLQAKIDLN